MTCEIYDEMMSLKLDEQLDSEGERRLQAHLDGCHECGPLWAAMKEADTLLCESAREPLAVPVSFHIAVMERVAVSVAVQSEIERAPIPVHVSDAIGSDPVRRGLTRPLEDPFVLLGYPQEWQGQVGSYLRSAAAVGLSIVGTAGVLLALVVSGTLELGGPFSGMVDVMRTFFDAVGTWVRSLFVGVGPEVFAVTGLLIGLLLLAGWQVVSGYHRMATQQRGNTGYLEALA